MCSFSLLLSAHPSLEPVYLLTYRMQLNRLFLNGNLSHSLSVSVSVSLSFIRFIVNNKSFTQQFSHVYNKRLLGLKAAVQRAAEGRWGGDEEGGVRIVDRLVNLREGEVWVVIGTTYKVRERKGISVCMYVCMKSMYFYCVFYILNPI